MPFKYTIGVSTVSFVGYELSLALDHIARAGYRYVEPAAVEKGLEHLPQAALTIAGAAKLRRELDRRGLKANALSAHSILTEPTSIEKFLPRIRFAADIGAAVCVTQAGPKPKMAAFQRNMEVLLKEAERLHVVIALETSGDIVTTGEDGRRIVEEWASPWLGLNYDAANVYRGTAGMVDPVDDFRAVVQIVRHLHLKDLHKIGSDWSFCQPGAGLIDTSEFLRILKSRNEPLGVNLELPYRLRWRALNGSLNIIDELPALADAERDISEVRMMVERELLGGKPTRKLSSSERPPFS